METLDRLAWALAGLLGALVAYASVAGPEPVEEPEPEPECPLHVRIGTPEQEWVFDRIEEHFEEELYFTMRSMRQ